MNTLAPQMSSALEGMPNPIWSKISIIRSEGSEQHKELHPKAEEFILLLQSLKMNDSKPENNGVLDATVQNMKEHINSTLGLTCPQNACNTETPPASNVLLQAINKDPLKASDEEIKQSLRNLNVPAKSKFIFSQLAEAVEALDINSACDVSHNLS
ncbi:hypothetical protein BPOR_0438g00050 [Botrytis porri]|uniref:Uncharacterized protein n=1 Tax=Botrytis porri TaxID=87229 RepID=A0A4Z1KN38_9HELO|nr:hypothetical protein BPOR_0438g00050 [Botrytis porri]